MKLVVLVIYFFRFLFHGGYRANQWLKTVPTEWK